MHYDYGKNRSEYPEPMKAEIKGSLPDWLQGTFVRNGSGLFSVGESSYNHWFDGMALLHNFTIKHGEVTYRSKYLRSDTYNSNMKANRIVVSEMGTMAYPHPSKSMFSKVVTFLNHTIPDFTDNCASNIIKYGNDYYATSETNYIRKIDPVTLETQDKVDYQKYLPVNLVISHPHYDKEGNTFNMGTMIADKGKTKYVIFKVPAADKGDPERSSVLKSVETICTLPCRSVFSPSYYHSFGMTENYIIFIEQPLKLDILRMATAYLRGVNWASCLKFHPEDDTLIHIIDRKKKKEVGIRYHTGAMVVYHHINAFEEDGHVVFDVITYNDNSLYDMFYLDKLKQQPTSATSSNPIKPTYKRFVLPLTDMDAETGTDLVTLNYTTASAVKQKDKLLCQPEVLSEGVEVPSINYNYSGQKHRYVYLTVVGMSSLATKITKLDVQTKEQVEWTSENCAFTEPVFVPRPGAREEDDGVVLTSVINGSPGQSDFLLVLDGKSFKEMARVYVNAELHVDMHGIFIPQTHEA
ncbi:beta,beta-carotene 15,15'-dioxygenase [Brachyhypopomus gauderio]|uniref:beta,beta-carotene 15,15'-dioxygenase n=1 Tax=Brachyhypopomus gauderio TaxID=698409 RepID=UPI00404272AD